MNESFYNMHWLNLNTFTENLATEFDADETKLSDSITPKTSTIFRKL